MRLGVVTSLEHLLLFCCCLSLTQSQRRFRRQDHIPPHCAAKDTPTEDLPPPKVVEGDEGGINMPLQTEGVEWICRWQIAKITVESTKGKFVSDSCNDLVCTKTLAPYVIVMKMEEPGGGTGSELGPGGLIVAFTGRQGVKVEWGFAGSCGKLMVENGELLYPGAEQNLTKVRNGTELQLMCQEGFKSQYTGVQCREEKWVTPGGQQVALEEPIICRNATTSTLATKQTPTTGFNSTTTPAVSQAVVTTTDPPWLAICVGLFALVILIATIAVLYNVIMARRERAASGASSTNTSLMNNHA